MTNLSKEKQAILKDDSNHIKVVAGPGSGKTTLIIEKTKELIQKGVEPNKILIITYTNKASEDIEKKIAKKIKEKGIYVSTFHGFCTRFMRENPLHFKEYKGFRVLDELGQLLFIVKWNKFIRTETTQSVKPLKLRNYFGRIKDNYSEEELVKETHPIKDSYLNYCQKLHEEKRMDFGDLINTVSVVIKSDQSLSKLAKEKFDYIFIDEYQDINKNQEALVKLFLTAKTHLMAVGDKNQSIYGFRGSDLRIFESFEHSFKNAKTHSLKKNYRSTWKIIKLTNRYLHLDLPEGVTGNEDADDGELTKEGNKVTIKEYPDEKSEAIEVIHKIKQWKDEKTIKNYSDVAILLRSVRGDSERFISVLNELDIPYEVIGDGGLFELDYIDAILDCYKQLAEKDVIINEHLGLTLNRYDVLDEISKGPLAVFYVILENSKYLQKAIRDNEEAILTNLGRMSEIITAYCEIFGYKRDENYLLTFYSSISRIDSGFRDTEQPNLEYDNSVKILTLHKSKGLEFPIVVIPGVSKDKYKLKNDDYIGELFKFYDPKEDMKRAFYVAMTRAKHKLIITYSENPAEYLLDLIGQRDLVNYEKHNQATLFDTISEKLTIESTEPEKETLELTYYKLIEYWKCPFAYKLRFHHNMLVPRTSFFTYGSILHSLLYHLNLSIINGERYDLDELIAEKVPNYLWKIDFKKLLQQYLSVFKAELRNIIQVERPFEFSLGDSVIKGRMDMMIKTNEGKYAIVEFKSGTWSIEKEEATRKQVTLYALSQAEYEITEGIIYFFGSSGKRINFKITKKQTELEIYEAITHIGSGHFEKNTQNCSVCVFNQYPICPYRKSHSVKQIDTDEEDEERKDLCGEL